MALEVVTDGKNDKTETNDQKYIHNKRTCNLFCVLPSFVLTDNKCILSCILIWSKQPTEQKQRRTETETVVFISLLVYSSFSIFFKIMQSKQRQIWSYPHLSSEDQNEKNTQLNWQETDNADTGHGW